MSPANYYERLGLRPNASVQDIRRAYRDLSKLYHPDTTELESAIAIPKFQAINEAYATLSSPEKRLTYDYQNGFSRLSVMQSFMESDRSASAVNSSAKANKYSSSAYLNPTDRPLSAGEFFALFILGITFIACLLLVVTLSLTKSDAIVTDLNAFYPKAPAQSSPSSEGSVKDNLEDNLMPELPEAPWLLPESMSSPTIPSQSPSQS